MVIVSSSLTLIAVDLNLISSKATEGDDGNNWRRSLAMVEVGVKVIGDFRGGAKVWKHGTTVIQDKFYIYGGNHNGRYLNDLHVLDLRSWTWSKIEAKARADLTESTPPVKLTPCAGHSLIPWENKLLSIAGHTKDPSDSIQGVSETVVLNMSTLTWSVVTTVQGRVPVASEGLSLVVSSYKGEDVLISFGGYNGRYNNDVCVLKPSHKSTRCQLKLEAKVWFHFLCYRLLPTQNTQTVSQDKAFLLYCLLEGKAIDIDALIYLELYAAMKTTTGNL
ncbi:hypothetical protein K1719_042616 [Acacia pycnantha]|nr:hypothetical protein K1719_042616 [Acacia pycnantha]